MGKTKKKTKRSLQAEATKKKICDAAIKLIEEKGLNTMTIQDINERAGVSVGTFYHYFSTKEDVFFELYRMADEYFEEVVLPRLQEGSHTVHEKIVLFFQYYAQFNVEKGLEYVSQLYSTKNKFFIAKNRYMIQLLSELVSEGIENGELTSYYGSEEITNFLMHFSRGAVFDWCLHDGEYDLVDYTVTHLKLLLKIYERK